MQVNDTMICDLYGNSCFEESMADVTNEVLCECPIECDSISYTYYTDKERIHGKSN